MLRILILLVSLVPLTLASSPVVKTGQVISYDNDGNVVTDGSIKDDGYYQLGAEHKYSRSGNIVLDSTTGLEWQDDVDPVEKFWLTIDNYNNHDYYNTDGDTAATYCQNLQVPGDPFPHPGWRLPTIGQLLTLVDLSQAYPASTHIFSHDPGVSWYWSYDTYAYDIKNAWILKIANGLLTNHDQGKNSNATFKMPASVRCVRARWQTLIDMTWSNYIVIDKVTGLQWQDNTDIAFYPLGDWEEAINFCENTLNLGGYTDWRMPNRNELLSIVDYGNFNPSINSVFVYTPARDFWSSSTYVEYKNRAWYVDFKYGKSYSIEKSDKRHVRCVRGGKADTSFLPSIIMYLLN